MGACFHKNSTQHIVEEFVKNIKPLDLIVFRGQDLISDVVGGMEEIATGNGSVSHVEVMITPEWCDGEWTETLKPDHPLSWGSTMSQGNVGDVETGKPKFGVQIRDLELLITDYLAAGGNVGYCRLIANPTEKFPDETMSEFLIRRNKLRVDLIVAYHKYHNRPYNANPLALLGVLFPSIRWIRDGVDKIASLIEANKWLFCSEFIAALYEDIGIITDSTDGNVDGKILNPEDVLPVDLLGYDSDHGIVNAICHHPVWILEPPTEQKTKVGK